MAQGGGQLNSFASASVLVRQVSEKTGLPHAGTRILCTSLSFLNSANITGRTQKKLWLFCGGSERPLRGVTYALRRLDRWFGSRLCIYGWACSWTNVCVRCGAGHPSHQLQKADMGKRRSFQCPVYHSTISVPSLFSGSLRDCPRRLLRWLPNSKR